MNHSFQHDMALLAAERFERGELDRRSFVRGIAALGLAPAVLASSEVSAQVKEIVVVNFGGDAVHAWDEAWAKPFAAEANIKVSVIGGEPTPGAIRAMVESGKVVWDAADAEAFSLDILGRQNLIQKYDYTKVDRGKVRPEFVFEHGCASYIYSIVNGYNAQKTGGRVPNGYKDFLNFRDFPGKRALHKWLLGSLEAVLLGSGVSPDALYPLDVERAFALIRQHRDQFLLWGGGAASQQLFRDGEVVMGTIWHSRATVLDRQTRGRLTWTWDNGIVAPGIVVVPVGNPAGPVVFDLIASMQTPERQIELLRILGGSPANPAASAMLPEALRKVDCAYEPNYRRQIPIDTAWYAQNYDKVQNDFLDLMSS